MTNTGTMHRFEHPAFLYGSVDEFLAVMHPFVADGIEREEFVFVAARGDNVSALREELADRSEAVRLEDTEEWHPYPGTRLRAFHDLATEQIAAGATSLRLAGEPVWPAGPPELVREWQRYESVLNEVLSPFPGTLVCLYDASQLDPSILATARRTHPSVQLDGHRRPSEDYQRPDDFLRNWHAEPTEPPGTATRIPDAGGLRTIRQLLIEAAIEAGVEPEPALDFAIAANEVITNALVHGGEVPEVLVWSEGDRFICQVEDRERGIGDPLDLYRPPEDGEGGRGLWIARQLVDVLQLVPGDGTTIRLHVRRTAGIS
jgi:anti-sigma regulatory factor (Ser/Thr protein kinase)